MEARGSHGGELCRSQGALQSRAFGRIRLLYVFILTTKNGPAQ